MIQSSLPDTQVLPVFTLHVFFYFIRFLTDFNTAKHCIFSNVAALKSEETAPVVNYPNRPQNKGIYIYVVVL